ncbi:MAG: 4Fe-4S binding protein [Candidatus Methanoperedens sp.]|nr:4Fe-4S binding protein [Candidatus Methanoperedens sp.]
MNGLITVIGCLKCGRCDSVCKGRALLRIDDIVRIDYDRCTQCMRCIIACPNKALKLLE